MRSLSQSKSGARRSYGLRFHSGEQPISFDGICANNFVANDNSVLGAANVTGRNKVLPFNGIDWQ